MDLSRLGESGIKENLESYIQGFSKDVREIFEYFNFGEFIGRLLQLMNDVRPHGHFLFGIGRPQSQPLGRTVNIVAGGAIEKKGAAMHVCFS